jgi:hypothetical protein
VRPYNWIGQLNWTNPRLKLSISLGVKGSELFRNGQKKKERTKEKEDAQKKKRGA